LTVEDNGACFIVKAQSGQALASVYDEQEPRRRAVHQHHATRPTITVTIKQTRNISIP
jgi:hypothetical protein